MGLQKVTKRWVFPFAYHAAFWGPSLRLGCGIPHLEVSNEVMHRRLVLEILGRPR